MSEELTIDEIKRLRAGITPPPWLTSTNGFITHDCFHGVGDSGLPVAEVDCHSGNPHDLKFIAAAPEAIDFLLVKLDEMRADKETMRKALVTAYDFLRLHDTEEAAEARIEVGNAICWRGAALAQHHGTEGEK